MGAANKALILRTEHNIKMIHGLVVEVVIILGITTHGIAVLIYLLPSVVAIVDTVTTRIGRRLVEQLLTRGDIGTSRHMKTKVLKTMNLIVNVDITHEIL